ncbi:MAG: M42 family peptidase [Clostridia bacterium]|nr:M42 family peptidase [Clostridia bacterium]
MDTKKVLFDLCSLNQIGNKAECTEYIKQALSGIADIKMLDSDCIAATFKGISDGEILFDAHIDQIGMVVTFVDDNGFVKVAAAGGIDAKTLLAKTVKILGNKPVDAVFSSTPPHLKSSDTAVSDITELILDTALGANAKDFVSVGDYVVYNNTPAELLSGRVTSAFLDNRAGVCALLLLADMLKGKQLKKSVTLLFSTEEELGCRKVKTSTFALADNITEAVAVDVTFATAPDVSSAHGGELGGGAMVGISPFLNANVTNKILKVAEENNLPYQKEVMGAATSTNADSIGITKSGIPTGLVSIPIRNMHTSIEVADMCDIENTAKLLYEYVIAGGVAEC